MQGRRKEGTVESMRGKENHAGQKEGGHSGKDEREGKSCKAKGSRSCSGKNEREGESCKAEGRRAQLKDEREGESC